jgi:hypothetical protein
LYGGNGSCVLKASAGPGAPGGGDFYVRVPEDIPWEWRGTYNDAEPLCYAGPGRTNLGRCPEYENAWWPNATAGGAKVFPYAQVLRYQADARGNQSADAAPYLPNVVAGFDPRPWEEAGPSFTAPTRGEWAAALIQARDLVAAPGNRVFGLPDASAPNGVRGAISIYAWNELGEGGIRVCGGVLRSRAPDSRRVGPTPLSTNTTYNLPRLPPTTFRRSRWRHCGAHFRRVAAFSCHSFPPPRRWARALR